MEYLIVLWIVCSIAGAIIGSGKNAGGTGFLLGVLLGPLGLLAAFAVDNREKCPNCGGPLNGTPQSCQHCNASLTWREEEVEIGYAIRCQRCKHEWGFLMRSDDERIKCPFCNQESVGERFMNTTTVKSLVHNQQLLNESKLKPCPDCGRQVSRRATSCPGCGCPLG